MERGRKYVKTLVAIHSHFLRTLLIFGVMTSGLVSCTGGVKPLAVDSGGMKITPGDSLVLDLGGIRELDIRNFRVSLRSIDPNFKNLTPFHDVTELARSALAEDKTSLDLILPKSVTPSRPFLVVVELLDLEDFLIDAIFTGTTSTRPDINSTLAYSLLESYNSELNPKPLSKYSDSQFSGLKNLIRTKTNLMLSQSEHLSLASVPFDKVLRFFKNGMAFNPSFLILAQNHGVGFRAVPESMLAVPGVTASATAENSLDGCFKGFCYKYPTAFEVQKSDGGWIPAPQLPFKQNSNNPAQILPGSASPDPALGLIAMEGEGTPATPKLEVAATGYDQDDDYFEKSIRVRYTPRILPTSLTLKPGFNQEKQEELPQDFSVSTSGNLEESDRYTLLSIGFHEALDTASLDSNRFPECSTPGACQTAIRDVFFMYTDGMVWVPYRWQFRYQDLARPPFFIKDQNQRINSDHFNAALQAKYQDTPNPLTPEWRIHDSHCETDPTATPPNSPVQNFYQQIQGKGDGPWSCAFKVSDPDLNDDPNGALDVIHLGIEGDDFTQIYLGAKLDSANPAAFSTSSVDLPLLFNEGNAFSLMSATSQQTGAPTLLSPPLPPASATSPIRLQAMTMLEGEAQCGGHKRCAAGLAQVVIDNAVKVAAEQQANQTFTFSLVAHDSKAGGRSMKHDVSRGILFKPKAPLFINYASVTPPQGAFQLEDLILNTENQQVPARHDIHLSEIMSLAKHASSTNPRDIGFDPAFLIGEDQRGAFRLTDALQTPVRMSTYLTQPRTLCADSDSEDDGQSCRGAYGVQFQLQEAVSGSPGHLVKLGNSLRMLDATQYVYPREFDFACNLEENNIGKDASGQIIWDQRSVNSGYLRESLPPGAPASRVNPSLGGWTFEINMIDPDNLDLRSGEPSDPVLARKDPILTNVAHNGSIFYCIPPRPNRNSLYYETYSATNSAGNNGIDPDSCTDWSPDPPLEMQPIPVYYTGSDISGPKTRKLVYHRLRGRWMPRDQGRSGKLDLPDPAGVITNEFTRFKIHGNVFDIKEDTRDLTEPRLIENVNGTPKATKTNPILFAAERKEMLPCLSGPFAGTDNILIQSEGSINSPKKFKVADTNHTNSTSLGLSGALSGRYEAELALLGNRNLGDFELLKFIPYLNDCTAEETRDYATASIVYEFAGVPGASSYSIETQDPTDPSGAWINRGTVPSPTFSLPNVPAYKSLRFRNIPNLSLPLVGTESTPVTLQANPMPGPLSLSQPQTRTPVLYSTTVDGTNPRIRFRSLLNHAPGIFSSSLNGNFCLNFQSYPFVTPTGAFTAVWRLTRSNPGNRTQVVLSSPLIEKCTGYKSLVMEPEYKSMILGAIGTGADCSFALNQVVANFQGLGSNDPNGPTDIEARVVFKIDPSLPEFGKLSHVNPSPPLDPQLFDLFWFPGLYAADLKATVPRTNGFVTTHYVPDVDSPSGLFFKAYPINTFFYDGNSSSPTFGRSTYAGYRISPRTDTPDLFNQNSGPIPDFTGVDPNKEYSISIRGVDFDHKLEYTSIASPSPDLSASPAPLTFFRNRPAPNGETKAIQVFSWPPLPGSGETRLVEFPITASDRAIGRTERDPYDVFSFALATPSPAPASIPSSPPALAAWGLRPDCSSPPSQFPLQSLLRLDSLADFKKCKITWNQREQDAGKRFDYLIRVQDNIGADDTVTPKILGLGARHPSGSTSLSLTFRYNPLSPGVILVANTTPTVRFTVDPEDGPQPGTTLDDTLPSCATSNICYRNRAWTAVPAQSCNHTTRVCTINVSQQYKLHFIEVSRQVRNLATNTQSTLVETREEQPTPSFDGNSGSLTNGPLDVFNLEIYNLEHNKAPYFTNSSGSSLTNATYSGPGIGNWGAIPLPQGCASGAGSGFNCNLQVKNGDTLWNTPGSPSAQPTPYQLQERSTPYTDFSIHVRDVANQPALQTITLTRPSQVLILDGPYAGLTYSVPSFSNSSLLNWSQNGSNGSAMGRFQWAPTDLEAHILSNPGGFLIPIKASDSAYHPMLGEVGFPSQFTVPSKESTIWIWCKLSVVNNAPLVQYMIPPTSPSGTPTWSSLENATIEVSTGVTNTITVRALDSDVTRYRLIPSERTLGFFPSSPLTGTATAFMSAATPGAPAGSPNESSPTAVAQNLVLSAIPTNSNLGSFTGTISVQDPGDPSLGLAILPNSATPPRAGLSNPLTNVSFNINVVGRPYFIVPPLASAPNQTPARTYSVKASGTTSLFEYPLALFVSRLSDRNTPGQTKKPHFIGVQIKPAVMPATMISNSPTGRGFRVNQDYVLKGRFNVEDLPGDRLVTLGSVPETTDLTKGCTATTSTDAAVLSNNSIVASLKRISDSGVVEYCNLTSSNVNNVLSQVSLTHTLLDGSSSQNFINTSALNFASAKLDRTIAVSDLSSINTEFLDFSKRCTEFCTGTPTGNGGFTLSSGEIAGNSTPTAGFSPALSYGPNSNGRGAVFSINDQNVATKTYTDQLPQTNSVMNSFVSKGEQLAFSVQLASPPAAPGVQARWYVNGCLKKSEPVTPSTQTLSYNMSVPSTGGGLNNDCSGQYSRSVSGGGFLMLGRATRANSDGGYLGDLMVQLVLANPSETISAATDGSSSKTYAFHMNVVNTIPRIMTETDPRIRAAPITVPSSSTNPLLTSAPNGIPSKFMLSFDAGVSSMYAYVGRNFLSGTAAGNPYTAGTSVHVREFNVDGGAAPSPAPNSRDLFCNGYNYALSNGDSNQFMFGLDASGGLSNLKIATSTYGGTGTMTSAYPTGTGQVLGSRNTSCYFEFSSQTQGTSAGSSLDTSGARSGQILAYSPHRLGSRGATMWTPSSGGTASFLIEGLKARSQFWMNSFPMATAPDIFATLPSTLVAFANNTILKSLTIPGTDRLIQLIGLKDGQFSNYQGAVLVSNLSAPSGTLVASLQEEISFGQSGCTFQGADKTYPIDAVYSTTDDILFLVGLELPDSGAAVGKLFEIRNLLNPTGNNPRQCRLAGNLLAPSREVRAHNPSNLRLAVDSRNGMLWGTSSGIASGAGQFFNYDYRSKRPVYTLPLEFQPGPVLHSPLINGIHLLSPGSGTTVPRILRVW
jgi:hypothetical protein